MISTPRLQTARLDLLPSSLADAPAIQSAFPRWEIVRYLNTSVPWPYPDDAAAQYLTHFVMPRMADGKLWSWSLRLRDSTSTFVGTLMLQDAENDNRGFWLAPPHWGKGLMSEACESANAFWFDTLKMPVLRVPKAVTNERSRQVSRREGMRLVRTFDSDYISGRLPTELWELTEDEWRARRAHDSRQAHHSR